MFCIMVLSGKGCSHTLRTPMLINSSQLNTWQYPARIPGLVLPLFMFCFFWELSWGIWYWNIYIYMNILGSFADTYDPPSSSNLSLDVGTPWRSLTEVRRLLWPSPPPRDLEIHRESCRGTQDLWQIRAGKKNGMPQGRNLESYVSHEIFYK